MDERFFSIAQARADLGSIGRTKLYELVSRGDLELLKLDGRSLITGRSLRIFKQRLISQIADSQIADSQIADSQIAA